MRTPNLLAIVDRTYGDELLDLARRILPDASFTVIVDADILDIEDAAERKPFRRQAHKLILSQPWDAMLSLYQELILWDSELQTTLLPLNVHPSRPHIRGMGYDTFPLIEGTATFGYCGATTHFMTRGIDEGDIIRYDETRLPDEADYQWVRAQNRKHCAELTQWLCEMITHHETPQQLAACLREKCRDLNSRWGDGYISTAIRDARLLEVHQQNSEHPVLRNNPKFHKLLAAQSPVMV